MSEVQNGDSEQSGGGVSGNTGGRRMTLLRRLGYAIGGPVLAGLVRFLWWTYRVEIVSGRDHAESVIADDRAYVPCYWHRDILVCLMTIRGWIRRGFRAAIIISPSVDGEVPARIARAWGAEVVRGSAKRTGALAMRELHQVMKRGVSIVTAADGPVGPAYYFKSGVLMTSRIGSAPMLPMGCAASRTWQFGTWDDFRVPKPFARVAVAIGEPIEVGAGARAEELEALRKRMQDAVNALSEESKRLLSG